MPNYEGLTVDEAIQKGLNELNILKDQATIKIVDEGKKGFLGIGKKMAIVQVEAKEIPEKVHTEVQEDEIVSSKIEEEVVTAETVQVLQDLDDTEAITQLALYLTNITKEINAPAMVRVERDEERVTFHLDSDKQGMLIGKHGKILNAFQYLSQVFIHRIAKNKLSVVVNVGDYRERREATLRRLAKNTAEKAKRTGQPVFLEPMPAFERKQIHSFLTEDAYVKTHSEGDEPFRYLVVEPEKNVL